MNLFRTKNLLLVLIVVLGMAFASVVSAQEATEPAGETTVAEGETEAGAPAEDLAGAEEAGTTGSSEEAQGEAGEGAEGAEEAATNPLTPLGINTGFLVAQCLNFLVILAVFFLFLGRPLMNMLDSRAARIQKGLEDAAAAANARRNAETEAERIRTEARADISRQIEEARVRGEEVARQIEADARAEAESIRNDARARAGEERDRQLADLRGQVAAIATAMAQRLIGETLDQQRQQALISDFFAKVPANARALSGDVEVVSAMPLTPEEQNRIRTETGAANVTFNVDPSILGGLIIRSQERVVDASVRNSLNDLAGRLR
jgi:F-type H+-transporting ATPase subunit b